MLLRLAGTLGAGTWTPLCSLVALEFLCNSVIGLYGIPVATLIGFTVLCGCVKGRNYNWEVERHH
jgi:hypothetical protein